MARSRSKPAAAKRSAPAPPPKPAAQPAQQQQHQQAPPPPQQPAMGSSGPGLMGMAASTMAGAVVGNVVGNGISRMMFGSNSAPVTDPQQMQEVQQAYGQGACQNNLQMYQKCMEANQNNSEVCNFAWSEFTKCAENEKPSA